MHWLRFSISLYRLKWSGYHTQICLGRRCYQLRRHSHHDRRHRSRSRGSRNLVPRPYAIAIDQVIRIGADTPSAAVRGDAAFKVEIRRCIVVAEAAVVRAPDPERKGVPAAGGALVAGETRLHAGLGWPEDRVVEVDGHVPEVPRGGPGGVEEGCE